MIHSTAVCVFVHCCCFFVFFWIWHLQPKLETKIYNCHFLRKKSKKIQPTDPLNIAHKMWAIIENFTGQTRQMVFSDAMKNINEQFIFSSDKRDTHKFEKSLFIAYQFGFG